MNELYQAIIATVTMAGEKDSFGRTVGSIHAYCRSGVMYAEYLNGKEGKASMKHSKALELRKGGGKQMKLFV